jgi:mRNA-degrading endonuclease RelE of RelBE toxin-antitoxin system
MPLQVKSTPYFDREYKKLMPNQLIKVHDAIDKVLEKPEIGEMKAGDLAGCLVYKFKVLDQLFLLGYEVIGETLYLQRIAPHGNYYRDWKNNRKK